MSGHTYSEAVERLNSLQSNAATLEAVRASGGRLSQFAIPEMLEYLGRIGYKPERLNDLNVIHITGTKGKGSTSAFTDSIIRHAKPDWKVGLYTSPHLVAVRERIRINGVPISEELFAKYFFEIWDRLQANTARALGHTSLMPGYFRFMTLLAFHAFIEEKVDATILEVGVGGAYDSTNIVPKPVITGVTALGIDHVAVLGKTIEEIAWQKGGIYKEGVPACTVNQPESAMKVLKNRAVELKASSFTVVEQHPQLSSIKLGLAGQHQVENAALSLHLSQYFLKQKAGMTFPESYHVPQVLSRGLELTKWPGRCQQVVDPVRQNTCWFLDGAHTVESLQCCFCWFASPGVGLRAAANPASNPFRILIFNCTSGRSGDTFLGTALETVRAKLSSLGSPERVETFFDKVIFCTNITYTDGHFKGDLTNKTIDENDLAALKTQHQLASAWSTLLPQYPASDVLVLPSIQHAIQSIDMLNAGSRPMQILVSGSLHLVGGVIEVAGLSKVAL
ncbi:hypothetical protein NMY22_g1254 [Coprinellus aureogranulatus]|nr:hypothetical protein NMY22_g1254 [Coprinellus aureogranulatus]